MAVRRKVSVLKMHAPCPSGRVYGAGLTRGAHSMAQVSMVVVVQNHGGSAAHITGMEKNPPPLLPTSHLKGPSSRSIAHQLQSRRWHQSSP